METMAGVNRVNEDENKAVSPTEISVCDLTQECHFSDVSASATCWFWL